MWVVVVTNSQTGTGVGWIPVATSPAMWAMSAMMIAPVRSAMSRKAWKSMVLG